MATWWYVVVIVVLAIAAFLYVRDRGRRAGPRAVLPTDPAAPAADFVKDREAARVAHMSADDRAWEAASLERQGARQAPEHQEGEGI